MEIICEQVEGLLRDEPWGFDGYWIFIFFWCLRFLCCIVWNGAREASSFFKYSSGYGVALKGADCLLTPHENAKRSPSEVGVGSR